MAEEEDYDRDQKRNRDFQVHLPWIERSTQVRLLRIENADQTRITGSLEVFNVSDLPYIDYIALSYCWGEARTDNDVHVIVVNGYPFHVRTNLWTFLEVFGSFKNPTPIYIDAICLNQLDQDERSEQVKLMSNIYRHANRTLVWLGTLPLEQDANLASLKSQLTAPPEEPWYPESVIGLSHLCARVYWRRLWIVQELLLSNDIHICCGRYAFAWNDIARLAVLPMSAQFFSNPEDTEWWHAWNFPRPRDYSQQEAQEARIQDGWQSALRLLHYRQQWLSRTTSGESAYGDSGPGMPIHEAVTAFRYQQCRDRRDKVFALIGLIDGEGRVMITPSYQDSTWQVFVQAAAACLVSLWKSRNVLSHEQRPSHEDRMYCGALNVILGLPEHDVDARILIAMDRARSYLQNMAIWYQSTKPAHMPRLASNATNTPLQDGPVPLQDLGPLEGDGEDEVPESVIELTFEKFKEDLTPAEITSYATTDAKALDITMAAIQRKQRAARTLQDMTRLRSFINALDLYSPAMGNLTGVNGITPFIWVCLIARSFQKEKLTHCHRTGIYENPT